jgi:hypothetical protein
VWTAQCARALALSGLATGFLSGLLGVPAAASSSCLHCGTQERAPGPASIPLLHDPAPDFVTRTTLGERRLSDYRGRWSVFFSHPADFTPVCTSEFIAFAKAYPRFQAAGCDLLA